MRAVVNNIDFDDANLLMAALGSKMFAPVEYWMVLEDAKVEGDLEMVKELASNRYAKWLNRVYSFENKNKAYIDAPEIVGNHKYKGEKKITEFARRPAGFSGGRTLGLALLENQAGSTLKATSTVKQASPSAWKSLEKSLRQAGNIGLLTLA